MFGRRYWFPLLATLAALAIGTYAAEPQFSAERMKAHVTFLADDLLEGREAGTRGHEIAARYVAAQFEALGVKPGGSDGYYEPVSLLEAAQSSPATLQLSGGTAAHTYKSPDIVALGPIGGGHVSLRAPLVFVGYGVTDAATGIDDYAGLDVSGKVVVALWGSPTGLDSEVAAHLQGEQPRMAAEHGAVAIVRVQTRATQTAFPWPLVVSNYSAPLTTWVRKDGAPFDPGHGLKLGVLIEPKAAAALFDRAPKSLPQLLDEAEQRRPRGFALPVAAEISASTQIRRYASPAVVGLVEGSDPTLKNEYVALMAHADHIGVNPTGNGDRINNGALDNAAGTATLLEVARAAMTADQRPRRSLLFVANTAEEKGLLGAEYFAHYPTVPIERIVAGIDLDMPLLLYDFTDAVAYGAGHSTLEQAFRTAAASMNVKLSPDPMPEQAIFVRSDHYALVKAGVPAVMLATGMENGGAAAWASFLAKNYHQPSDDVQQNIVWSAGAKFAELNYRVVRELADAPARPQWYAGDYFGNLFAPVAPKAPHPERRP